MTTLRRVPAYQPPDGGGGLHHHIACPRRDCSYSPDRWNDWQAEATRPLAGRMVVATDDDYQPESADGIRRLADSYRPTLREERAELRADRELVADEFGGRTW